jgi:hypothetical protein
METQVDYKCIITYRVIEFPDIANVLLTTKDFGKYLNDLKKAAGNKLEELITCNLFNYDLKTENIEFNNLFQSFIKEYKKIPTSHKDFLKGKLGIECFLTINADENYKNDLDELLLIVNHLFEFEMIRGAKKILELITTIDSKNISQKKQFYITYLWAVVREKQHIFKKYRNEKLYSYKTEDEYQDNSDCNDYKYLYMSLQFYQQLLLNQVYFTLIKSWNKSIIIDNIAYFGIIIGLKTKQESFELGISFINIAGDQIENIFNSRSAISPIRIASLFMDDEIDHSSFEYPRKEAFKYYKFGINHPNFKTDLSTKEINFSYSNTIKLILSGDHNFSCSCEAGIYAIQLLKNISDETIVATYAEKIKECDFNFEIDDFSNTNESSYAKQLVELFMNTNLPIYSVEQAQKIDSNIKLKAMYGIRSLIRRGNPIGLLFRNMTHQNQSENINSPTKKQKTS